MRRIAEKSHFRIGFSLSVAILVVACGFLLETAAADFLEDGYRCQVPARLAGIAAMRMDKPVPTRHYSQQSPASLKPVLAWTKVEGAVSYEIELFTGQPGHSNKAAASSGRFFTTKTIYVNGFNADLSDGFSGDSFYWRVRGLDLDGNPLSAFSEAEKVYVDRGKKPLLKPIPTSVFNQSPGSTLLYPVYAWIPVAGAEQYEVEILDGLPENPNGVAPSVHRIDAAIAVGFDYYDEKPRISEKPFYWRVRGLDAEGNAVGVYSDAGTFTVNPGEPVTVATYGDSITHGGGSVSYSPADWEYSYQHYLDFPTINLGKSGDTSQTMIERFDEDVVPFHPQYLIILAGTNSLRGGVAADSVIEDLEALKEKCLAHDIIPVFLTLPPINPDNIKKVFDEDTVSDWQVQMQLVNNYIRTQNHIDVARDMHYFNGTLPTKLAVDGLHLDIKGKRKMADAINANWPRVQDFSR